MSKRAVFSIVAAAVLLVSSNASGNLIGTMSNGTFSDPSPTCPPATCNPNSNPFTWGSGGSSLLAAGSAFNAALGTPFMMGSLTFANNLDNAGTFVDSVTLTFNTGNVVATAGEDASLYSNVSVPVILDIVNNPNTADPGASADVISIRSGQPAFRPDPNPQGAAAQFSALEPNQGGVAVLRQIWGVFGSASVVGFRDPDADSAFVATPEPSSIALLGGGLVTLVLAVRKRRRR
jgi:PEP-CTERM motif